MKFKYLFFLVFFMPMWVWGQVSVTTENAPKKLLKLYEKAEKCFAKNQHEEGIRKLKDAIELEPMFLDAHIRLGGKYYDQKEYAEAIRYFKNAAAIEPANHKITQAIAISYEHLESYSEAVNYYQLYLEQVPKINKEYKAELDRKLLAFEFRKNAMERPSPFEPKPLTEAINKSEYSEYSPSLTADGRRLFFTRVTQNQEDIYYSEKDSTGQWSEALLLPNLNTLENEGAHTISADGKTILFTYCSDRANPPYRGCNIYGAFRQSGTWSKPKFFAAINSKAWDTQPNISADGSVVVYVSKRPGGKGESDLWWSHKNEEGKWKEPVNLGSPINTPLREESPFLHPDGKTLYFKSEGHPGMGSFDLFMSTLDSTGSWSTPVNLGFPINTKDHEGAMIVALDGKTAYYSKGDGAVKFDSKKSDIYTFTLPEDFRASPVGFVKITVLGDDSREPIKAAVNVQSSIGEQRKFTTDNEGEALILLPTGENFSLNIDKENYYFHSERFELDSVNTSETAFEIVVYLRKIEAEKEPKPIILRNVLFDTGLFTLKEESYFELDKLASLLKENPEIKIEIRGHTDDVGDETDNQLLSENRAKAVYTYLVDHGISASRLSYIGLGESMPISNNDTAEGRKMNRRTEFITKQ